LNESSQSTTIENARASSDSEVDAKPRLFTLAVAATVLVSATKKASTATAHPLEAVAVDTTQAKAFVVTRVDQVARTRKSDTGIDGNESIGSGNEINVNVDVSSDLEQAKGCQVDWLGADVCEAIDSSKSKFDGQINEQLEFDSGRQVNHDVSESLFTLKQVGDGQSGEK